MTKKNESISITEYISKAIKKQAEKETRSFSNMIEVMAKKYLANLKK